MEKFKFICKLKIDTDVTSVTVVFKYSIEINNILFLRNDSKYKNVKYKSMSAN